MYAVFAITIPKTVVETNKRPEAPSANLQKGAACGIYAPRSTKVGKVFYALAAVMQGLVRWCDFYSGENLIAPLMFGLVKINICPV